jgi:hypothetical protein
VERAVRPLAARAARRVLVRRLPAEAPGRAAQERAAQERVEAVERAAQERAAQEKMQAVERAAQERVEAVERLVPVVPVEAPAREELRTAVGRPR